MTDTAPQETGHFAAWAAVERWMATRPDRPAFSDEDRTITWAELASHARSLATGLREVAVGPGDRIAILDKNSIEAIEVLLASALIGSTVVSVNWRLSPTEVAAIINDAEAQVLVVGEDLTATVEACRAALTSVHTVVTTGQALSPAVTGTLSAWLARPPADIEPHQTAPDDVLLQLYTSGTTGSPKGVMLTAKNLHGLELLARQLGFDHRSRVLVVAPLFHIGGSGMTLMAIAAGGEVVMMRAADPVAILQTLVTRGITHAFFVPALLRTMLQQDHGPPEDFHELKKILYGASPITEGLLQECIGAFQCDFVQTYGLTETAGAVAALQPEDHLDPEHPERLRSAGRAIGGSEIKIVDLDTGEAVPPLTVGEVLVRSPQNMAGYWKNPEETARALDRDGWLHTGDAGLLDLDGYLFLKDRVKDMIISGGENIYPAEVENALSGHPQVADVAVIGVPSERWGEEVKAIVVLHPGASATGQEIITWCRERIASYKCPLSVDIIDALPRNPNGKVLKRELRSSYWTGSERGIQ